MCRVLSSFAPIGCKSPQVLLLGELHIKMFVLHDVATMILPKVWSSRWPDQLNQLLIPFLNHHPSPIHQCTMHCFLTLATVHNSMHPPDVVQPSKAIPRHVQSLLRTASCVVCTFQNGLCAREVGGITWQPLQEPGLLHTLHTPASHPWHTPTLVACSVYGLFGAHLLCSFVSNHRIVWINTESILLGIASSTMNSCINKELGYVLLILSCINTPVCVHCTCCVYVCPCLVC
jgi:hypothetical protein